ncbi:MAG: fumarylacetoacetate hydrolase family protein [Candidatus Heimdallarchaeota archaeon]|nr:fumarylacetoacetate hydrolase family protein [Candidatus Heimdallarchaeota archaeon]
MRIRSIIHNEISTLAVSRDTEFYLINQFIEFEDFCGTLKDLLDANLIPKLQAAKVKGEPLSTSTMCYTVPYYNPSQVWGIGLNYVEHAKDLDATAPDTYPVLFMKPSRPIGYGNSIILPRQSQKTTGEAELGIIIGKKCRNVKEEDWLDVVAGFTTILDMTAEDLLRQNTRWLSLSKSFETFFSFGPEMITPDDLDLDDLKVATTINNNVYAENYPRNMRFSLSYLVSFLSELIELHPGDIISTGTPRATPLKENDVIECRIEGFVPLINTVVRK